MRCNEKQVSTAKKKKKSQSLKLHCPEKHEPVLYQLVLSYPFPNDFINPNLPYPCGISSIVLLASLLMNERLYIQMDNG